MLYGADGKPYGEYDHYRAVNNANIFTCWLISREYHAGLSTERIDRYEADNHFRSFQQKLRAILHIGGGQRDAAPDQPGLL